MTRVAAGDRVADHAARLLRPLRTTACAGCQHLCATMGCVGLSHAGAGWRELATVAEYQIVRLPDERDLRAGRADRADGGRRVRRRARRRGPGDRVLVTGAGPIGALAALCARAAGASAVYVSEPNPARRARAEALGVATVLDPAAVDVPAFLREQSDGLGVDVAIECSGHPQRLRHGHSLAAPARDARADGAVRRRGDRSSRCCGALNDLTIVGTWCYWVYDFERIAAQIAAGDLPVERVVTQQRDARRRAGRLRRRSPRARRTRSRC